MKIRYCSAALAYHTKTKTMLLCTNKKQDTWGFPKGGLEPGLTPAENAAKECGEETGFTCADKGFSLGTYEIVKEGVINQIEVFALELGSDNGKSEGGRRVVEVPFGRALVLLDRYLQPFVVRLAEHLEACDDHDRLKRSHREQRNKQS